MKALETTIVVFLHTRCPTDNGKAVKATSEATVTKLNENCSTII